MHALTCPLLPLLAALAAAPDACELQSPDGNVVAQFRLDDRGAPGYTVRYGGAPVLGPSRLGLTLADGPPLESGFRIAAVNRTRRDATWKPVYGERSEVRDRYDQLTVDLEDARTPPRRLRLTFRAYAEVPLSQIKPGCERPLTVRVADDLYAAVAEARLVDYARMKLAPVPDAPFTLASQLSSEVEAALPLVTPWRVVMLGRSPGELLENNDLILNLNDACAIDDPSWIKPGKVIREVTLTTEGGKACVDFAAEHNLQYVEFDAGWYGHEYSEESDARTVTVDPKRSPGGE